MKHKLISFHDFMDFFFGHTLLKSLPKIIFRKRLSIQIGRIYGYIEALREFPSLQMLKRDACASCQNQN